jgi:hypothetical protein
LPERAQKRVPKKSTEWLPPLIPAQAGIQKNLGPRFRRDERMTGKANQIARVCHDHGARISGSGLASGAWLDESDSRSSDIGAGGHHFKLM